MSAMAVFDPTPQDLRELVLEYLLYNSYIDTALAFAKETSDILHDNARSCDSEAIAIEDNEGDNVRIIKESSQSLPSIGSSRLARERLELVRLRREIFVHIMSGRIDTATQLINTHFPAVLEDSDHYDSQPVLPIVDRLRSFSQVSLKPIHVALNLRILAFIEAARTKPLPYPSDPLRSSISTLTDYSSDAYSAHQTRLLHLAQRLYASVESLQCHRDRERYREELQGVGGLLAYRVPEESSMAIYLSMERREAVANQVNSAIQHHLGIPAIAQLELYTRQTATVWSTMHDMQIKLPPPSQRPVKTNVLADANREAPGYTQSKPSSKSESVDLPEIAPEFDFHSFLDAA